MCLELIFVAPALCVLVFLVLGYRARLMTLELDWAERYASLETDRDEWQARTVEAQQQIQADRDTQLERYHDRAGGEARSDAR